MRFTRPVIVSLVLAAPAITYAQEPEQPEGEENVAEEYAKKGTFEVGGALGASITQHVSTVSASPTAGYFVADRIEVSAALTLAFVRTDDVETGDIDTTTTFSVTAEPSYHHPISDDLLVVGGLGVGAGYDGDHPDFEVIPRVGVDIVTARANVITPSVRLPILVGRSHGSDGDVGTDVGVALDVAVKTTW